MELYLKKRQSGIRLIKKRLFSVTDNKDVKLVT